MSGSGALLIRKRFLLELLSSRGSEADKSVWLVAAAAAAVAVDHGRIWRCYRLRATEFWGACPSPALASWRGGNGAYCSLNRSILIKLLHIWSPNGRAVESHIGRHGGASNGLHFGNVCSLLACVILLHDEWRKIEKEMAKLSHQLTGPKLWRGGCASLIIIKMGLFFKAGPVECSWIIKERGVEKN